MDTSIDSADASLTRLLAGVVEAMQPVEVWLFGSRAEGRARADSDYDLLVVLPDDAPARMFDPVFAWRIGRDAHVNADVIPCTRSDVQEEKDEIDTLARAAVLRGRRLYER